VSYHLGIVFIFMTGITYCSGYIPTLEPSTIIYTILSSGIVAAGCQILYISAVNLTKNTGILTISNFLSILTSYFISFFQYEEPINIICVAGLGIIVYGVWTVVFKKDKV
jgi:hypothetical protein